MLCDIFQELWLECWRCGQGWGIVVGGNESRKMNWSHIRKRNLNAIPQSLGFTIWELESP